MTYRPNFQDTRVQSRIRNAIGFACGVLSPVTPHEWSTRYIDRWFGQQQNALGGYIRNQLLIVTNESYSFGDNSQCKQYILNQSGVDHLCDATGLPRNNNTQLYPIVLQVANEQYQTELATGEFEYKDQSHRLWHPLQNFRREYKHQVLEQNGYQYHYDIVCSAMTLIHQYSQQIPEIRHNEKWQQRPMELYLWTLRDYLQNRHQRRQELADSAEIDSETAKRMINALLAGARLSANHRTEIFQMLGCDLDRLRFLQQHQWLNDLRADIKTCWNYIRPTLPPRFGHARSDGSRRRLAVNSRQKWMLYFDLERQVLNEVREYLNETQNLHFLEHDGWSCQRSIDQEALQQRIHERTGFRVEFEMKSPM
jgi:hypothetical protein